MGDHKSARLHLPQSLSSWLDRECLRQFHNDGQVALLLQRPRIPGSVERLYKGVIIKEQGTLLGFIGGVKVSDSTVCSKKSPKSKISTFLTKFFKSLE